MSWPTGHTIEKKHNTNYLTIEYQLLLITINALSVYAKWKWLSSDWQKWIAIFMRNFCDIWVHANIKNGLWLTSSERIKQSLLKQILDWEILIMVTFPTQGFALGTGKSHLINNLKNQTKSKHTSFWKKGFGKDGSMTEITQKLY